MDSPYFSKIAAFICFFSLFTVSTVFSQSFDFERSPQLNFQFSDATIDLQLNPEEKTLNGSVEYRLKANIDGADTLRLQAAELQIDSVLSQGQAADFDISDNVLSFAVTDSSVIDQQYRVQIFYHGSPTFGLLKSSEGSMWTSMLPLSNRHWVPILDHPGVNFISTLSLTVPEQYSVAASGVKTDEETLGNGNQRVTFRTGQAVPATAIGFAIGSFAEEGISFGIKRINSYAEPNSIDSEQQRALAEEAEGIIQEIENATEVDYPYQRLHIVLLNDHYWEQKPYGASTVFLYKNRGDLAHQLRRGIYAQWFGVYQREVQWANAWPINFFQTALHFSATDEPAALKNNYSPETNFTTVYDNFSVDNWNFWQQYSNRDRSNVKQIAERIIPELLKEGGGTFTPDQYRDIWYRFSGQPGIDVPSFKPEKEDQAGAQSDSVRYRVDYELAGNQQNLQLVFRAQQSLLTQTVTLPVEIISGGGSNASSVSFAGRVDSTTISLPAGTQNVRLNVPQGRKLILEERKPVPFLLYQLRNAETTEARRAAAEQIGYNADNPDLQLALNDFMDQPMEPEVEAALLRSFGDITNGATGTQRRFVEALSNESRSVRAAALEVLNNYDDEGVTKRLKTFSENERDTELSNKALKIYLQRIDSTEALQFTNTLVQQDTSGTKAIVAIEALARMGRGTEAVKLANFYIEPVYAYPVRKQAFEILLQNDESAGSWKERIEMLLNDYDPRIRFLTVKSLDQIPGVDANAVLSSQKELEYDARVFKVMSDEQ